MTAVMQGVRVLEVAEYDGVPAAVRRAPEFNEHGDEILASLGRDWDAIVDLKVRGVTA